MPRFYKTGLWQLKIPDGWKIEGSGELIMMFRPDGVGTLHIEGSDTVGRYDLLAYARDHSPPGTEFTEAACGRLRGFTGVWTKGGTLWRTWWLSWRGQLVYAAYQCAAKNSNVESSEVDDILQSFDETHGDGA